MEKHSESRLSYLFAHLHLLSSDLFSSDSSHLCFSTVHIVGSFTSKLPSINPSLRHSLPQSSCLPPLEQRIRFAGLDDLAKVGILGPKNETNVGRTKKENGSSGCSTIPKIYPGIWEFFPQGRSPKSMLSGPTRKVNLVVKLLSHQQNNDLLTDQNEI